MLSRVTGVPAAQQPVPDPHTLSGQARHSGQHAANLVQVADVVVDVPIGEGVIGPLRQPLVLDLRCAR